MDFELPVSSHLFINLRDRTMVTNEEQVGGCDETVGVQVPQPGFGVEWVLSGQPDHSGVAWNPFIWCSSVHYDLVWCQLS